MGGKVRVQNISVFVIVRNKLVNKTKWDIFLNAMVDNPKLEVFRRGTETRFINPVKLM